MKSSVLKRVIIFILCGAILFACVSLENMQKPILAIADCANAIDSILPKITSEIVSQSEVVTTASHPLITATPTTAITKPVATTEVKAVSSNVAGKIKIETIGNSGATNVENLHIANKAGVTIDAKKELAIKPDFKVFKNSKPQVLIMHTHATECFFPKESDVYYKEWQTRTTDSEKNTVALGQIITDTLNNAGISTIHDTTQHDAESYNGSYERARETISSYLEKYPSIDVVLDIHRDAITYDDNTKLCPIAEINGKKAAQIMICTGCNSNGVTEHKNWIENFRFAIRLQQSCEKNYPSLARPLYFVSKRYNHDLTYGSLLVEVGSEANTLDQAKYSALLLAKALIPVLNDLQ